MLGVRGKGASARERPAREPPWSLGFLSFSAGASRSWRSHSCSRCRAKNKLRPVGAAAAVVAIPKLCPVGAAARRSPPTTGPRADAAAPEGEYYVGGPGASSEP